MVLNDSAPQYTYKPFYIVKRTPQNTLLTITNFIHSQNSNEITCPETNKPLISINKWFGDGCFARTKNIDLNSFNKFRDDYSSYVFTTYNKENEFVKISTIRTFIFHSPTCRQYMCTCHVVCMYVAGTSYLCTHVDIHH